MKSSKNKTQDSIITGIITAASLIAFIGGYVLSSGLTNKNYITIEKNVEKDEVIEANASLTNDLSFNEANIYQRNENVEYMVSFPNYFVDNNTYYMLSYGNSNYEIVYNKMVNGESVNKETIEFDLRVIDVAVYKSNDITKDAVFYLFEDGSVEYTLMDDAIGNNFLRTNGRLNEVYDVVKFFDGYTCKKDNSECNKVLFAQNLDGTLYNISEMI